VVRRCSFVSSGTIDIWWIDEGQDYPRLWWELIPENQHFDTMSEGFEISNCKEDQTK